MKHIYSQGDYDGACFLYALANAYSAVTGKKPPCSAWDNGIRTLKYAHDFLGGCIGTTEHFSSDPQNIPAAVTIMLSSFNSASPSVRWVQLPTVDKVSHLATLVDRDGVVIFHYQGETTHVASIDHWVCGVAATTRPLRLHLACSYRKTQDDGKDGGRYRELYHPGVKRYSNNWLGRQHHCQIFAGSVFRIWQEG